MKIDEHSAQRFMHKIATKTIYNVNVINEDSKIIAASKEKNRIGEFHPTAYSMITHNISEGIVTTAQAAADNAYPGVNFLIRSQGVPVGVIGVTGDPKEVYDIASIIRMAFETMIEYEGRRLSMENHRHMNEHFFKTLLYHEGSDSPEMLPMMAQKLGFDPDVPRLPVVFCFKSFEIDFSELEQIYRSSTENSSQDIICSPKSNYFVLFINLINKGTRPLENYRFALGAILSPLLNYIRRQGAGYRVYIGSFENRLIDYCHAYRRCQWLIRYTENLPGNSFYLYDYLRDYFNSLIPPGELAGIYQMLADHTPDDIREIILQCIPVLDRNNYNLIASSRQLYIHKNTLIYRLSKINSFFSLNPQKVTADRNFLTYLCLYFTINRPAPSLTD